LTFTTIPGAGATDATSFVGTDGNDILSTFNTLTAFVGAQAGNDAITAGNVNGLVDWQVKSGAGNDTLTFTSDMLGGRVNGNAGGDTMTLGNVLADAAVFGGQNNDQINVTGALASSRVNGNLGDDQVTIGVAATRTSVSAGSIFGGQGADTITLESTQIQGTVVGGNLGNDTITINASVGILDSTISGGEGVDDIDLFYDSTAQISGVVVNGGEGNDTIDVGFLAVAGNGTGAGLVINGDAGADAINASGRNDTIDGGLGADTIDGAAGADTLTGGRGTADQFNFASSADTIVRSGTAISGTDVITDWEAGATGDRFVFAPAAAPTLLGNFTVATLDDALAAADAAFAAGGAQPGVSGVWLVGVGTANSLTAYAITIDGTAGAVQLGDAGVFSDTATAANFYGNVLVNAQLAAL
jgi:Ca2+-binding RTX toxin-like protein